MASQPVLHRGLSVGFVADAIPPRSGEVEAFHRTLQKRDTTGHGQPMGPAPDGRCGMPHLPLISLQRPRAHRRTEHSHLSQSQKNFVTSGPLPFSSGSGT
ncbi:hypothetical protein ABH917_002934 [Thermobifida halotolerans]